MDPVQLPAVILYPFFFEPAKEVSQIQHLADRAAVHIQPKDNVFYAVLRGIGSKDQHISVIIKDIIMVQFISSKIIYRRDLSQRIHPRHLGFGNAVVHGLIPEQKPVAPVADDRHLAPQHALIVIIVHKVQSIAVIAKDHIESIGKFLFLSVHFCFQNRFFFSQKASHLIDDFFGIGGSVFFCYIKSNGIVRIRDQADHLKFMLCRILLFLPDVSAEIPDIRITDMDIVRNGCRFFGLKINVERLGVRSKGIVFDQHIACRILSGCLLLFQPVRDGLLVIHLIGCLDLFLDLFLLFCKTAFYLCIRICRSLLFGRLFLLFFFFCLAAFLYLLCRCDPSDRNGQYRTDNRDDLSFHVFHPFRAFFSIITNYSRNL